MWDRSTAPGLGQSGDPEVSWQGGSQRVLALALGRVVSNLVRRASLVRHHLLKSLPVSLRQDLPLSPSTKVHGRGVGVG